MNKPEFVKEVAHQLDCTQVDATKIIDTVFGVVFDFFGDGGEDFRIGSVGTLKRVKRASRRIRNIQTGDIMQSKEHFTLVFKPSPSMKEVVNDSAEDLAA